MNFKNPASTLPSLWLLQYGMNINNTTDSADPDGDGMTNYQEWRSGSVPTNALSFLKMFAPSNSLPGIGISWQSLAGRKSSFYRSTDLQSFLTLQSNISASGSVSH